MVWNYGSLGVQAIVGVTINFVIILRLGADSLGVFNQIYAIYVVAGQVSVLGLDFSAQKHVAQHRESRDEQHRIALAAMTSAILTGLCGALILGAFSGAIGRLTQSANVGQGVLLIAPGLFFFSINKVLMGALNGQRRMAAFALCQSVRALGILLVCVVIVVEKRASYEFGASFTLAEGLLLILLIAFVKPMKFRTSTIHDVFLWMPRHLSFGCKSLSHGVLSEAFLRIDIIMLAVFVSDREVGIYSFAALFVEGAYQVSIVVRNISNPILVPPLFERDYRSVVNLARKTSLVSISATLFVIAFVMLLYPQLSFFLHEEIIGVSYPILWILMGGLLVYSAFVPFDYIFLEAGRPGVQSVFMAINTTANIVLNFTLIPILGLYGASIATAFAFLFSSLFLNVLAAYVLDMRGGIFVYPRNPAR